MASLRATSPAHSLDPKSPRLRKSRRTRSVCSATSGTSVRLSKILQDSFQLSPVNRKSVLNDVTDIDEPASHSWWKKMEPNSRNVTEIMEERNVETVKVTNIAEVYDFEVLSQEDENMSEDLPESSDGESIHSIIIPQHKIFTKHVNQPQLTIKRKFINDKENIRKSQKSFFDQTTTDQNINVMPKKLFNQGKQKTKPAFSAGLLSASANKTLSKSPVRPTQGQGHNLFVMKPKQKKTFGAFLLQDSKDEIPDIQPIQPKLFGFSKKPEKQHLLKRRSSSMHSSESYMQDGDFDEWKHLASSTRVEHQFEIGETTPLKQKRLSRLPNLEKSPGQNNNSNNSYQSDKTNLSNSEIIHIETEEEEELNIINKHSQSKVRNNNESLKETSLESTSKHIRDISTHETMIEENNLNKSTTLIQAQRSNYSNSKVDHTETEELQLFNTSLNKTKTNTHITLNKNKSVKETSLRNRSTKTQDILTNKNKNEENTSNKTNNRVDVTINNEKSLRETSIKNSSKLVQDVSADKTSVRNTSIHTQDISTNKNKKEENTLNKTKNDVDVMINNEKSLKETSIKNNSKRVQDISADKTSVRNRSMHTLNISTNNNKNEENTLNKTKNNVDVMINKKKSLRETSIKNSSKHVQDVSADKTEENIQMEIVDEENKKTLIDESADNCENFTLEYEDEQTYDINVKQIHNKTQGVIEHENKHENESEEKKHEENEIKQDIHDNNKSAQKTQEKNKSEHNNQEKLYREHEADERRYSNDVGFEKEQNETDKRDTLSPEAVLQGRTHPGEVFTSLGRTRSMGKSKTIIKELDIRPSLASDTESTGLTDGSLNFSAEGSGWDSHRTTRQTLRQTFGKDFTPRKSLRALAIERSAKRQTNQDLISNKSTHHTNINEIVNKTKDNFNDLTSGTIRMPMANSTEYPDFESYHDQEDEKVLESGKEKEQDEEVVERHEQSKVLESHKHQHQGKSVECNKIQELGKTMESISEQVIEESKFNKLQDEMESDQDGNQCKEHESNREQGEENETDKGQEQNYDFDMEQEQDEEIVSDKEQEQIQLFKSIREQDEEEDILTDRIQEQSYALESDEEQVQDEQLESDKEQEQSQESLLNIEQQVEEDILTDREQDQSYALESDEEQEQEQLESEKEQEQSQEATLNREQQEDEDIETDREEEQIYALESDRDQEQDEEMESDREQEPSQAYASARELENEDMETDQEQSHELESDREQEPDVESESELENRNVSYKETEVSGDNDTAEESNHDVSKQKRLQSLERYLLKVKQENAEARRKLQEQVMNSLKMARKPYNPFKIPEIPKQGRISKKPTKQTLKVNPIIGGMLPPEFLEDLKYKPPKRFRGKNAPWITKRLYKYLEDKLKPKYDYRARVRAEKLVEKLYNFAKDVRKLPVAPPAAIADLKHEMARLCIVSTHYDFYCFFHDFMPREVRIRVNPDIMNKIPAPRSMFADILDDGP